MKHVFNYFFAIASASALNIQWPVAIGDLVNKPKVTSTTSTTARITTTATVAYPTKVRTTTKPVIVTFHTSKLIVKPVPTPTRKPVITPAKTTIKTTSTVHVITTTKPAPTPIPTPTPIVCVGDGCAPAFAGKVWRGVGSFFSANLGTDSTNGNSWCGYKYNDQSNGFAPDLNRMTDGTQAKWGHPQWEYYGKLNCGAEANVTNIDTGKWRIMYIIDAFDPYWVRTPGSIDIMKWAWYDLSGGARFDKNHVLNVKWELTGRVSEQYKFQGPGN